MLCWENYNLHRLRLHLAGPAPDTDASSDLTRQILSSWLDRALSLLREELLCSAPLSWNGWLNYAFAHHGRDILRIFKEPIRCRRIVAPLRWCYVLFALVNLRLTAENS